VITYDLANTERMVCVKLAARLIAEGRKFKSTEILGSARTALNVATKWRQHMNAARVKA
jgi:hypothetical protein